MSKNEKRKAMRATYFTKKAIELQESLLDTGLHPAVGAVVSCSLMGQLRQQVAGTPHTIFRTDRPEIDKRRAKRWREAQEAKYGDPIPINYK